ncbi:unnamed protein product, partial [Ectocarpus sp. 12 AP-2014]
VFRSSPRARSASVCRSKGLLSRFSHSSSRGWAGCLISRSLGVDGEPRGRQLWARGRFQHKVRQVKGERWQAASTNIKDVRRQTRFPLRLSLWLYFLSPN